MGTRKKATSLYVVDRTATVASLMQKGDMERPNDEREDPRRGRSNFFGRRKGRVKQYPSQTTLLKTRSPHDPSERHKLRIHASKSAKSGGGRPVRQA